ncbi:MAG TPA: hypothetical protein VG370_08415, partial [Chloroflexota bacterium]|nr:hypothetical protein [Chloroflexota bacterium]
GDTTGRCYNPRPRMDYEKPSIPPSWEAFANTWAEKLGLGDKEVRLICSTERFGAPIILRLAGKGPKLVFTRRSSDAHDAPQRRKRFIDAATSKHFDAVEIDIAGFFVEEALVAPAGSPARTQWRPAIVQQLLRVAEPELDVPGEGDQADHAEDEQRARKAEELLKQG